MRAADLVPEIMSPYDVRHVPLPPPAPGIFDCPTVQVCINSFWVSHLDGLLERLIYRDAWLGTEDEIDRAIGEINKLLAAFKECNMSCGCGESLSRLTADGVYQESDDGGVTWHDAPEHDPRNMPPQLPPLPGENGTDKKCAAANSIVGYVKMQYDQQLAARQSDATIADFEAILAGLLLLLGLVTGGLMFVLGAAIAVIVANVTAEAFEAAFTEDVWKHMVCALFCNMSDDGSISAAQINAAREKFNQTESGIAYTWTMGMFNAMGTGGMNNAAKLGMTAGVDCSDCDCTDPCDNLHEWHVSSLGGDRGFGVDLSYGDNYVEVTSEFYSGDGAHYITLSTDDPNICCTLSSIEVISGPEAFFFRTRIPCGEDSAVDTFEPVGTSVYYLQYGWLTGPTTMRFHFTAGGT